MFGILKFVPYHFVENLGNMGIGMIGIFLVIGILIGATYACNRLTNPKKKDDGDSQ